MPIWLATLLLVVCAVALFLVRRSCRSRVLTVILVLAMCALIAYLAAFALLLGGIQA